MISGKDALKKLLEAMKPPSVPAPVLSELQINKKRAQIFDVTKIQSRPEVLPPHRDRVYCYIDNEGEITSPKDEKEMKELLAKNVITLNTRVALFDSGYSAFCEIKDLFKDGAYFCSIPMLYGGQTLFTFRSKTGNYEEGPFDADSMKQMITQGYFNKSTTITVYGLNDKPVTKSVEEFFPPDTELFHVFQPQYLKAVESGKKCPTCCFRNDGSFEFCSLCECPLNGEPIMRALNSTTVVTF